MKISVITTTCRPNPRLDVMARTLAASLRIAPEDVTLEWQICDQLLADPGAGERHRGLGDLIAVPGDRFSSNVCRVNGGTFLTPAHIRNAALERVTGDFVVFLDDCTVVTKNFLGTAAACAAEGRGWRVKSHSLPDLPIPADGKLRYRDHYDRLSVVPATTVGGPCWGAPRAAITACGGFDPAYDGELKHNQQELIVRLARAGLTFVTTARARAVTLRRTHIELAGREAYVGIRNALMFNALQLDRGRTLPGGIQVRDVPSDSDLPGDVFGDDETPVADVGPDSAPRAPADRAETAPVRLPGLPPTPPPGVPRSVPGPAPRPAHPARPAAPRPITRRPKPAAKVVGRIGPAPAAAAVIAELAAVGDALDELDGAPDDDDFLDGLEGQLEALESEGGKAPADGADIGASS